MLCVRIKSSQIIKHMAKTFFFFGEEYYMFQFNSAVGLDNKRLPLELLFPETIFLLLLSYCLGLMFPPANDRTGHAN